MDDIAIQNGRMMTVSGTIPASPGAVFAILSEPARHTEIDGSGMLRGLDSGPSPVTRVGDAFVVNMRQDGIGDYQMRNTITIFELGRAIAWAPAIHPPGALRGVIGELNPSGHTYGWLLEPTADGHTRVTHTYNWSGVRDEKALALYPRVSEAQLSATIARLVDAVREPLN